MKPSPDKKSKIRNELSKQLNYLKLGKSTDQLIKKAIHPTLLLSDIRNPSCIDLENIAYSSAEWRALNTENHPGLRWTNRNRLVYQASTKNIKREKEKLEIALNAISKIVRIYFDIDQEISAIQNKLLSTKPIITVEERLRRLKERLALRDLILIYKQTIKKHGVSDSARKHIEFIHACYLAAGHNKASFSQDIIKTRLKTYGIDLSMPIFSIKGIADKSKKLMCDPSDLQSIPEIEAFEKSLKPITNSSS